MGAVYGPEEVGVECSWMIDERASFAPGAAGAADSIMEQGARTVETPDMGPPGTQFRVTLRIVGKWRYVDWQKLDKDAYDISGPETLASIRGTYYVSMQDGTITEMTHDSERPGVYTARVADGGRFQILRNADWCQAFYPPPEAPTSGEFVLGPDEEGYEMGWRLGGAAGQEYEVTFERRRSP